MENLKTILRDLKNLGCTGIKISFEDEGALLNEHILMSLLTHECDLELSIKIGGCEAKRDISDCQVLNSTSIVAPMIESKFALQKFINSCKKYNVYQSLGFNLETISAFNNIEEIKELFVDIEYVTFGRVDFVSSLNKDRKSVDDIETYNFVEHIFKIVKKLNRKCYLGGAISILSEEFIMKLIDKNLLDKFETRYIIFDTAKITTASFKKCIYYANLFEVEWLKHIRNMYLFSADKNNDRIIMIEERIKNNAV